MKQYSAAAPHTVQYDSSRRRTTKNRDDDDLLPLLKQPRTDGRQQAVVTKSIAPAAVAFTPSYKSITPSLALSMRAADQKSSTSDITDITAIAWRDIEEYNTLLGKNVHRIIKDVFTVHKRELYVLDSGCGEAAAMHALLKDRDMSICLLKVVGTSRDYYAAVENILKDFFPKFMYFLGSTQDILKHERLRFDLIFDVWGTASYAQNQIMDIFVLYYDCLEIGGRAYIHVGGVKFHDKTSHPPFITLLKDGKSIYGCIFEVLPSQYPHHFEFSPPRTLIIYKVTPRFPISGQFIHLDQGLGLTYMMEDIEIARAIKIVAPGNVDIMHVPPPKPTLVPRPIWP